MEAGCNELRNHDQWSQWVSNWFQTGQVDKNFQCHVCILDDSKEKMKTRSAVLREEAKTHSVLTGSTSFAQFVLGVKPPMDGTHHCDVHGCGHCKDNPLGFCAALHAV